MLKISEIMDFVDENGNKDETSEKAKYYQKIFQSLQYDIENQELRMAILAPLKSGKTTIINTIIGQKLLPTRVKAMTALPTKIVFTTKELQPTLLLNHSTIEYFKYCIDRIKTEIEDNEQVIAKINKDLKKLVEKIQNSQKDENLSKIINAQNEIKIEGQEKILNILTDLNDLIRLYHQFGTDRKNDIIDIPCIYTPLFNLQKKQKSQLGNLVIVDTPGVDDVGGKHNFEAVVRHEVEKSSMVLLVIDFTKQDNKIADQIREEVNSFINLRGQDNLYIVVNKWDINLNGTEVMDFQDLQESVAIGYKIDNSKEDNRVFAVSGLYGEIATQFWQAPKSKENSQFQEIAKNFLRIYLRKVSPEDFENTTLDELGKKVDEMWNESRFSIFLENVINLLIEQVAPRSMISALNYSYNSLKDFTEKIKFRISSMNSNFHDLEKEISNLQRDKTELKDKKNLFLSFAKGEIEKEFEVIDKSIDDLKNKINNLKNNTPSYLKTSPKEYVENSLKESEQYNALINNFHEISEITFSEPELLYKYLLGKIYNKGILDFKFSTEKESKEKQKEIIEIISSMLGELIEKIHEILNKNIKVKNKEFEGLFSEEILPFVKKVITRINNEFMIDFSDNPPELEKYLSNLKTKEKRINDLEIYKTEYSILGKFKNLCKRMFGYEIRPYKILIKEYFILMYEILIEVLKEYPQTVKEEVIQNNNTKFDKYFSFIEYRLEEFISTLEKSTQNQSDEVRNKLKFLTSEEWEKEVITIKNNIQRLKDYTEQILIESSEE
jgi:hypothetical protein